MDYTNESISKPGGSGTQPSVKILDTMQKRKRAFNDEQAKMTQAMGVVMWESRLEEALLDAQISSDEEIHEPDTENKNGKVYKIEYSKGVMDMFKEEKRLKLEKEKEEAANRELSYSNVLQQLNLAMENPEGKEAATLAKGAKKRRIAVMKTNPKAKGANKKMKENK